MNDRDLLLKTVETLQSQIQSRDMNHMSSGNSAMKYEADEFTKHCGEEKCTSRICRLLFRYKSAIEELNRVAYEVDRAKRDRDNANAEREQLRNALDELKSQRKVCP